MSDKSFSDKFGWQPGYTHGDSEGKWEKVPSGLMKYERAGRLTYGPPNTEQYRSEFDRIFGRKNATEAGEGHGGGEAAGSGDADPGRAGDSVERSGQGVSG